MQAWKKCIELGPGATYVEGFVVSGDDVTPQSWLIGEDSRIKYCTNADTARVRWIGVVEVTSEQMKEDADTAPHFIVLMTQRHVLPYMHAKIVCSALNDMRKPVEEAHAAFSYLNVFHCFLAIYHVFFNR
jgi:hypothetical protein